MNKYKPLEQYVDAVGGADALADLASIGHQIRSNPELAELVSNHLNGTPQPKADVPPEEEIYDPELKMVDERYKAQLAEQTQTIRDLTARLNRAEVQAASGALEKNVESALALFSEDEDAKGEALSTINATISRLQESARNGDRQAAQQLESLSNAQGVETLNMMTAGIYRKSMQRQLEEARASANAQPNGEAMRSKSTDAPSDSRASLETDTIAVVPGAKLNPTLAQDVLRKAAIKHGKDPDKLFAA